MEGEEEYFPRGKNACKGEKYFLSPFAGYCFRTLYQLGAVTK
jgi:hypothetical protein